MSSEKELRLLIGSVKPFDIVLKDENDVAENLTNATRATFRIVADRDDTTYILDVDTGAEISIDKPNSRLSITMTQVQADALTEGVFFGQANIEISSSWYATDPFWVTIEKTVAPRIA